jgi:hypothetical protein
MAESDRTGRRRASSRPTVESAENEAPYSEDVLDSDDLQQIDNDAVGQSWEVAERSRPDLDDETADGLSPLEEEVRRQAEDVPVGPISDEELGPPSLPGIGNQEQPIESAEIAENYGDIPGMTDQSEDDTEPVAPGRDRGANHPA